MKPGMVHANNPILHCALSMLKSSDGQVSQLPEVPPGTASFGCQFSYKPFYWTHFNVVTGIPHWLKIGPDLNTFYNFGRFIDKIDKKIPNIWLGA